MLRSSILLFYILLNVLLLLINPVDSYLVFSTSKEIRKLDEGFIHQDPQLNSTVIKEDLEEAVALDFDYDDRIIFWSDIGFERISGMHLNDSRVFSVISSGIIAPDGLACDWITKKIYWADSDTNKIEVSNYNGNSRTVLFWENLDQPRAIALVPAEGLMFWSDWGIEPKIERASMDGTNSTRQVIVRKNIIWPNGLTVDYTRRKLYWVDAKLGHMSSSDFDGQNQARVNCSLLFHPFAITMLYDILYWTDWETSAVHSCNKTSGVVVRTAERQSTKPMGITTFDPSRQPKSMTPCLDNNGNCSHLCLLSSIDPFYSCACPTGLKLSEDGKTCPISPQKVVILARRADIRRISLDTNDYTPLVLPFKGVKHATVVDYDPVEERVYWADDDLRAIKRAMINGSQGETIIETEVDRPDGIAIDWVARNFYWTDAGTDRIEVARLDGSSRKVLLHEGIDQPRAIAVHPNEGLLFWSDWGEKPKIERAALDGSQRRVIVDSDIVWPNGLVIDYELSHIYWADAKEDRIEMARFDGSERRMIFKPQESVHFFGFSLLDEWIYWSDWQKRSIERVHKLTGNSSETIVEQLSDLMGIKAVWLKNPLYLKNNALNPCSTNNGNCSHLCLNRPHQDYVCSCPFGHNLLPDNRKCQVSPAHLLLLQPSNIASYSFETGNFDALRISGLQNAISFGVNIGKNRIYWIDSKEKVILQALLNATYHETVVHLGLEAPESLVVDWISGNIYWTDTSTKRVEVARHDGSYRKVIYYDQKRTPELLAIDPIVGFLFWTDKSGKIERTSLNGEHAKTIITDTSPINAISPTTISGTINGNGNGNVPFETIDSLIVNHPERKLYWLFNRTTILSCNYDGTDKSVVFQLDPDSGRTITRIVFHHTALFMLDNVSGRIESINLHSTIVHEKEFPLPFLLAQNERFKTVGDLFMFHPLYQQGWNPCAIKNGNCEHLCFAKSSKKAMPTDVIECGCATHYIENDRACLPPESFMLYSQRTSVTRFLFDRTQTKNDFQEVTISIPNMKNVKAMTFDPYDSFIYWIDSGKYHTIRRVALNGTNAEVILHSNHNDMMPLDLVIDPYSRILFWSCGKSNSINATRLIGRPTSIGSIYGSPTDKPHLLAYHVGQNFLFWSNDIHPPQIERIALPGHVKTTVVAENLHKILAIAVDHELNFLIWADKTTNKIEYSDLDGKHRLTLYSEHDIHPLSMASYSKYLFWIEKDRKSIEKIPLDLNIGNSKQTIFSGISHLSDIISVQAMKRNSSSLFCLQENSGCSHICLNNMEGNVKCACPSGLVLAPKDDKNCVEPVKCDSRQFGCTSGTACIDPSLRCNGVSDCPDNSDEIDCPKCTVKQFTCYRSNALSQVIQSTMVYQSDNNREDHLYRQSDNEVLSCLDNSLLCDGKPDCLFGDDEKCCFDKFRCHNQHCLSGEQVCDGKNDCLNGEDEEPGMCAGREPVNKSTNSIIYYILFFVICLSCIFLGCLVFQCSRTCRGKSDLRMKDFNGNSIQMTEHNGDNLRSGSRHNYGRSQVDNCNTLTSTISGFEPLTNEGHLMMDVNSNGNNQSNFCPSLQKPLLDGIREESSTSGNSYPSFPCQTLNPPPSPVTTERSQSCYSSHSSSLFVTRPRNRNGTLGTKNGSNNSARRHKKHSKWAQRSKVILHGPPPTPCGTDNYEELDSSSVNYVFHNNPTSICDPDDEDDFDYKPPPPTPRHYFSDPSCPPSPSPPSHHSRYSNPPPPPSPI